MASTDYQARYHEVLVVGEWGNRKTVRTHIQQKTKNGHHFL